jgi:pimeloyl-ACP methyl ester carboxylesterase
MELQQNQIISFSPVVLPAPGRHVDLEMKITAPANGKNLPILLLSHGHGQSNFLSSYRGYGPLSEFFASRGFIVIQPTHQNSKTLALDAALPEAPLFWSSRPKDMQHILDNLDTVIAAVPGMEGRADKTRIAAMGHSLGGHTVGMLAGMQATDPTVGKIVNATEPRIKAFVIIGSPGAPSGLSEFAKVHYPILAGTDFTTMSLPALIVNGDEDKNPNFSDQDNWRADGYYLSKGPKSLLTVYDAEHIFGGISGYDALETSDESPERVAFVCQSILAYLRTALNPKDASWSKLEEELNGAPGAKGHIDNKQ